MILGLSDNSEKKIELKIKSKLEQKKKKKTLDDGFKKNKVVNEVLDKTTILQLYDLINSKIISYVHGVVKAGKESVVFWAKKEFQNISKCYDCGINVVKPIHISKNVLVMEFIGIDGKPEKNLLESHVVENDYHQSLKIISDLYHKANLVHGDFSEYNIFKTKNGLKLFDLGSAVDLEHPHSNDLLKRDINNISNFFVKRGLTVENPLDVFERITK